MKPKKLKPLEERFWRKVKKTKSCWEWCGSISNNGYGRIGRNGANELAHRISYEIKFGPVVEGFYVCHKCDNPKCVNPDHLFMGTPSENMRDAMRKGRHKGGVPSKRLKIEQVKQIREMNASGVRQLDIASKFGVSFSCVSRIVRMVSF